MEFNAAAPSALRGSGADEHIGDGRGVQQPHRMSDERARAQNTQRPPGNAAGSGWLHESSLAVAQYPGSPKDLDGAREVIPIGGPAPLAHMLPGSQFAHGAPESAPTADVPSFTSARPPVTDAEPGDDDVVMPRCFEGFGEEDLLPLNSVSQMMARVVTNTKASNLSKVCMQHSAAEFIGIVTSAASERAEAMSRGASATKRATLTKNDVLAAMCELGALYSADRLLTIPHHA